MTFERDYCCWRQGILDDKLRPSRSDSHGAMRRAVMWVTPPAFHHQPEAQHPKYSAFHKLPADYPIFRGNKRTLRDQIESL